MQFFFSSKYNWLIGDYYLYIWTSKLDSFFLQGRRNKMGGNLIGRMDVGWKSNEMKCRRLSVGTPPGRMGVWAYAGYKRRTNWSVVRAKQSLARDCLPERWNR